MAFDILAVSRLVCTSLFALDIGVGPRTTEVKELCSSCTCFFFDRCFGRGCWRNDDAGSGYWDSFGR